MFKSATFTLLIGAFCLSSACIITSDDDDGNTTATTSPDPTNGDTGSQTTAPGTSDGTTGTAEETTAADDTGAPAGCGWGPTNDAEVPEGYTCGGEGEDPEQMFARECPEGLVEGEACGDLTGVGCCDADGNVWFCWMADGEQSLVMESC